MGASQIRLARILRHLEVTLPHHISLKYDSETLSSSNAVKIEGFCDPGFDEVRKALAANFAIHDENGASVCVYHKGKCVVDLWGSKTGNWKSDSIANIYSSTKVLTTICAHILVDRGLLDLDKPVASYWPGFEKNGKGDITLRHILSHCAGLPTIRAELPNASADDWLLICKLLQNETPRYHPSSGRHGYHTSTFGWLVGEVIRRVSGKTVGRFFRDEVGDPFGVDCILGISKEEDHARIVDIIPDPVLQGQELDELISLLHPGSHVNNRSSRSSEMPALNGHANARGLARLYAILADGGSFEGKTLISKRTLDNAVAPQVSGNDETLRLHSVWSSGFMRFSFPDPSAFGYAGYGGCVGFADPNNQMSFGYVQNALFVPEERSLGIPKRRNLVQAVYKALKKYE